MTPAPGAVLRRSILVWGLGDLALGDRSTAIGWLVAELIALAIVAYSVAAFADSTWYLLPFLLGTLFIAVWAFQAVRAFRRAEGRRAARPPTPRGSPAAAVAWLTVPLLAWGTGFWLIGAGGASPAAVLDRFISEWPEAATQQSTWKPGLTGNPSLLTDAARSALDDLRIACRAGELNADCATTPANLLHDVRMRVTGETDATATAVAEWVEYVQRPTSVLFVFNGTELVPVARDTVLRLQLVAKPVSGPLGLELGARRWEIASASR